MNFLAWADVIFSDIKVAMNWDSYFFVFSLYVTSRISFNNKFGYLC